MFNITADAAGAYNLAFRYTNDVTTNYPLEIRVNNIVVNSALPFPSTGNGNDNHGAHYYNYSLVNLSVSLAAGANTVRVATAGSNGPWLDGLIITKGDGSSPTPTPAHTPTPAPTPTVPPGSSFSDNFDDGNANGWTTYDGTWSVVSGQYNVGSNPGAKSIVNSTNFSNFTYDADLSINGGNAGIIFRVANPASGVDSYSGYYAGLSGTQVILGKANNSWTQLVVYNMTITANTIYHMRVVANGSNIQVFVTDMATAKINSNDSSFTAGAIGLRTYNSAAKFDNISVTTGSTPTPTPTPTPSAGVIFYQDSNYGGTASQTLAKGDYTLAQLNANGVPNEWMTSLKVPSGWTVIVYQNDNFGGTSWTFTTDTPNVGSACNDQMTSCRIQ